MHVAVCSQTRAALASLLMLSGSGEPQSCEIFPHGTHRGKSTVGCEPTLNFVLIHGHAACCESPAAWV